MDETTFIGLLERTLTGLGYELVDGEFPRGGVIRIFIDGSSGINVDDCALVSNHLTRLFAVEDIDYTRLEVSSPGLDRPLRLVRDFVRFQGERARIRMRFPIGGQKNFVGILRGADEREVKLDVEGALVSLSLTEIQKARLEPNV